MSQSNISQAYNSSQKLGASASQTEARALLETARRMSVAKERMEDLDEYRAALRLNWRLWTIFQADVASDDNPLPPGIKANILSLSVFIDKHTVGALTEPEERRLGAGPGGIADPRDCRREQRRHRRKSAAGASAVRGRRSRRRNSARAL